MSRFRMIPSERAGYAPGLYVVQRFDVDARLWFDIGDPLPREQAQERLEFRRSGGTETTTGIESDD